MAETTKARDRLTLAYQEDLGSFRGVSIIAHWEDDEGEEQANECKSIKEALEFLDEDTGDPHGWIEVTSSNEMASLRFYIGRDEHHYFQAHIVPKVVAKYVSQKVKDQSEYLNLMWEVHNSIGNFGTDGLKKLQKAVKRIKDRR